MDTKYWYAVYTRPFWERKVSALALKLFGLEAWCPMRKTERQWSDRIKMIEEPYFRGYVFVRVSEKEKNKVLKTDGVLNFVRLQKIPARISDAEINSIKVFISQHSQIEIEQFSAGELIKLNNGAFAEYEGIIEHLSENIVTLQLPLLNCRMVARLSQIKKIC